MDLEKDLIEVFEAIVHKDFANPERVGCPGQGSLMKLASELGNPEFVTILAYIHQCAPCFDELNSAEHKTRATLTRAAEPLKSNRYIFFESLFT